MTWTLEPAPPRIHGRIAFLSGGGTISYGETLLDIIEGYKIGVVVGETSAGANGAVVELALRGGFSVTWTGSRVRRRDGSRLFGQGIPPDLHVAPTIAGLAAGTDEVLERALAEVAPH